MLEFAWKAYNKLNFDRNVKLSLPDWKRRRLKNNAENVTDCLTKKQLDNVTQHVGIQT